MSDDKGWWERLSDKRILVVSSMIAASQGLNSLNDLAISYLYKDDYHFGPARVSSLSSLKSLPWTIKPLWGLISDNIPFFGYKRKSYIILFGIISVVAHLTLATWSYISGLGISMIFMISFCIAFYNVIGEALLVESSQRLAALQGTTEAEKQKKASNNISLFFGVKHTGVICASYFGGLLLELITKNDVFRISSIVPMLVAVVALMLPEKRVSTIKKPQTPVQVPKEDEETTELVSEREQEAEPRIVIGEPSIWLKVWNFVKMPDIYIPLFFLFLFRITPSTDSAMFFFYSNELHFAPGFMGTINLFGSIAVVVGIIIYNKFLKNVHFKKVLLWSSLICFFLELSQIILVTRANVALGIPDKVFCLGDSIIINVFGEINLIPMLVLVCRLCPKNVEGTMYALFLSIFNAGGIIGTQLGALFIWLLGVTESDFTNLWLLILISACFILLPLPWLHKIHFDNAISKTEEHLKKREDDGELAPSLEGDVKDIPKSA